MYGKHCKGLVFCFLMSNTWHLSILIIKLTKDNHCRNALHCSWLSDSSAVTNAVSWTNQNHVLAVIQPLYMQPKQITCLSDGCTAAKKHCLREVPCNVQKVAVSENYELIRKFFSPCMINVSVLYIYLVHDAFSEPHFLIYDSPHRMHFLNLIKL